MICWSELFPLFCASLGGWGAFMSIGASKCQSEGWAVVQQKGRCEVDEGVTGDFHPQNLAVLVSATNEELNFKQATVLPLCRQGRDNKSLKLIIY